ncbi:MAG TPA: SRPBCC domain-containing protein, partial [Candidatus Paceibacterota bacterium]|nr:SRPBCC domain-containing protein [Candidatus Paceibacterota bacterium]
AYTMEDGRKVTVTFTPDETGVRVVETFDPESENPREMQQAGWQAILDNFKKYVEAN